jgi:hypothetical protein
VLEKVPQGRRSVLLKETQVARLLVLFFGSNCSFSILSVRIALKKCKFSWSRFNSFLKNPDNRTLMQC